MSLRGYATRRGVSPESVSKAITAGRLRSSVVLIGGQPKIADAELADREWEANTQPRIDQPRRKAPPTPAIEEEDDELPEGVPAYDVSRAVREAHAARREAALADLAEIDVAERNEELVPVDEARSYMIDKFTTVKTRLLGVPSRVASRLPELASQVEPVVDALIREVLEELAAEDDGDGEEDEAA